MTAGVLILVGGILEEQRGLLAIAALGGAVIGLLAAGAAASPDGVTPPLLPRRVVTRLAVGLALATIAAAGLGIWVHARLEGGVMDPLSYLWATLGLYVPAQAVIAAIAAAWGAGNGPIRWRA
jgi:hypothetical protein